ncbi:hypothetical protein EV137_0150 [Kribbella pratensis]|uniref:Novel STAND NTPase 1 domain-containing protein n=1 Tax=Kribbella pratensis TaxID=2512112 RepID=A0ABY2FIF4_9ACTN|nr:hypothetical protein [Kribbella pratensis]TDW92883.1 hypothetical protein EV137_0150 [Kribbella pratensis]
MARSHSHQNCAFGADGFGYSPRPESQFAFGSDEDRDQLFKNLSTAFEELPDPVTSSVAELTPADVKGLLETLDPPARGAALRPLGLNIQPRKVATAMAADAANRLRRISQHERRRSAERLVAGLYVAMLTMALGPETGTDRAQEKLDKADPHVLRLALWAGVTSSAIGARVVVWAASQPWYPLPGATPDQLEAVAAAAQAVADGTEGFDPIGEAAPTVAEAIDQEEDTDQTDPGDEPEQSTEPADIDLEAMLAGLDESLDNAASAARALSRALESGRPPAAETLAILDSVAVDFERVENHIRSTGVSPTDRSLSGLREALETSTRREDEAPIRAALSVLGGLHFPAGDTAVVAAVDQSMERAAQLLDSTDWSDEDRTEATAIAEIAGIATGTLEPAELVAAQSRVIAGAPHLALIAVLASTLGATPTAGTDDVPTDDDPVDTVSTADVSTDEASTGAGSADEVPTDEVPAEETTTAGAEPAPATASEVPFEAEPVPAPSAASEDQPLTTSVATLIAEGRHALAGAFAAQAAAAPVDPVLLQTSALSAAVRNPHGEVASALRHHLADLDSSVLSAGTTSLLLAAPALIRAALVTGEPAAGALLIDLAPHLGDQLGEMASQIGKRAVQGVFVTAPPLTALTDVTDTERILAEARAEAEDLLHPRRLRFKRASDIVNGWLASDGLLGAALTIVARDERDRLDVVTATISRLNDHNEIARAIDNQDRRIRSGSSKALQGAVRNDLIGIATAAVKPLIAWYQAASALALGDQATRWSTSEVAEMREAVLSSGPTALDTLGKQADSNDPLVTAAAVSARASLEQTLSLLDGRSYLDPAEFSPASVLGLDLLHVRGAHVDVATDDVRLPTDLTPAEVASAMERGWDDAVRLHVGDENYSAARYLVDAARIGMLSALGPAGRVSDETAALMSSRELISRDELERDRVALAAELRRARINNEIDEEQDAELTARLDDSERPGTDLAQVRSTLEWISRSLPDYRKRAAQALRDRLEQTRKTNQRVGDQDFARINGFIVSGDLGTAEELIYLLETNEQQLPSPRPHEDLRLFFPQIPDALPDGITDELIRVAREGTAFSSCPTLDFSSLSSDQATRAADALAGWRTLRKTQPEKRYMVSESDHLLPALRIAGLEAKKVLQPNAPRARDRRFVDVSEVTVNGKAMVPAFGSNAGDRRRILLAWGEPSADTLMSWVDQDPAGDAVIVAYFGTMSAAVRRELARLTPSSQAPVIVLDDAALAYLAARGDRLLEATMMILLPFAHINPYVRQKRGLVAPEMFYGRKDEQRQVIDKDSTQIVYGGRGLGKSALLRDAEAEFERSSPGPDTRVAIYLSLDDLRIGTGQATGAETLWDGLLNALIGREIIAAKGSGRSKDAHARVVAGVTEWLDQDSSRRLLILLDESDRFFEADQPAFFQTSRLRNLGTATKYRAKVVLAGLHSVQRFAKVASNGPFSHLAQRPTVIGPLRPQSALNLLVEPMAAMGYEFEEPDLINRVLAKCSYQPFLLQMFGHRLVERMHKQRREHAVELPYRITREDIDAVESHEELREDISTAFRDTLNLDPRYNVIANVMARNAHESGLEARLTDTELLEECLQWWDDGFSDLDTAAFRAYLSEMVGLGVLARNTDGHGWRLRGPAVLTMIGTTADVESQLLGAETESLREDFVALATREKLEDARTSPVTASQLDDLLGDYSTQVRVVMGSDATGIADTATAIRAAADIGGRFTVPPTGNRNAFESALIDGTPGQRRVIICDLTNRNPEVCTTTLRASIEQTPDKPGVTRAVVLITNAHQMPFWREVEQTSEPSLGTVALQRYDARTLRAWSILNERFGAAGRLDKVMSATGGWPFLVDRIATSSTDQAGELRAIESVTEHLATEAGAEELVRLVGIRTDDEVARAYSALVTMLDEDSADLADLHSGAGEVTADPELVVACLMSLGVFTPTKDGHYQLEPLLADAWSRLA